MPGITRMSTSAGRSTRPPPAATAIASPPRSSATCGCSPTVGVPVRERLIALAFVVHLHWRSPPAAPRRRPRRSRRQPGRRQLWRDRRPDQPSFDLGRLSRRSRHFRSARRPARHPLAAQRGRQGRRCARAPSPTGPAKAGRSSRDFAYGTVLADPCGPAPTERVTVIRGDDAAAGADHPPPDRPRRPEARPPARRGVHARFALAKAAGAARELKKGTVTRLSPLLLIPARR